MPIIWVVKPIEVTLNRVLYKKLISEVFINMVLEKLKTILSEQFDVDESEITMDTNIYEDLEADSLDLVDLLSSIEEEFDIETDTDDDIINSINTVGDIVNFISEIKNID